MESLGGMGFSGARKPRSTTLRRPRPEAQLVSESCDISPLSSTPSLNNSRKLSPDDDGGSESSIRRKEIYLNNPPPKSSSANMTSSKKIKGGKTFGEVDGGYHEVGSSRGGHGYDLKRCSEGVLAPAKWNSTDKVKEDAEKRSRSPDVNVENYNIIQQDGASNATSENKPRKVKLKVGGVTHTILKAGDGGTSAKPSRTSDTSRHRLKIISRDYADGHSLPERGNGSQGDQRKDFSGSSITRGSKEESSGTAFEASLVGKQADKLHIVTSSEPTRKSKRVPKKRVFDDDEEDDEIRYLEKLKTSKVSADDSAENAAYEMDNSENSVKKRKISKLPKNKNIAYEMDDDYLSSLSIKENRKKLRAGKESDDTDYVEEEELASDVEPDIKKRKQKETNGSPADVRSEPLTTRQRALQSGKGGNGESFIEFPNGLPPAPSRKQKEKLSEVEIQAKKAEAAQRRKMQVEKQARESEAEAIRKILGQDSDKKKEEKKQKELEEKAKSAKLQELGPSTIRWVIGPLGTVVTFADDVGLPTIFNSKPCSYPPPREKCAAPSCTNAYKYRDSKTKLPLCSLQCYKAVQRSAEPSITC
ncbi:transcriptional regulator ATRX-like isoform X2 [Canna indica]|uniref:Transcriptional regulator ATRX-like isoform X2 n=1 Tax=Canna indica TaxID=4628 RepID=A0AAQ3JUE3_9LILI|nr:transcriptional regulator ATRX-like isoform X2 [Canna indica]